MPHVEDAYQAWRLEAVRPYSRMAMITSTIAALAAFIATCFGAISSNQVISLFVIFIIAIQHAAGIFLTTVRRFSHWVMPYSAAIHIFGGTSAVLLTQPINNPPITAGCVVIAVVFGFVLFRLPPLLSLVAISPYVILGEYLATLDYMNDETDHESFVISIFMPTAVFFAGIVANIAFERISRENYRAARVIEDQTEALEQERASISKFLSPSVTRMIHEQGLDATLRQQILPITAVCCDLRGFTAYTHVQGAAQMAMVLKEYYATVVEATARYGGTIKDFAGDGVLIFIGAPVTLSEHAQVGLDLARDLLKSVTGLTSRHSTSESPLGVGIGVASGHCAVGAIDAQNRMVYTAVGEAVNLASRLCSSAMHKQILISPITAEAVLPSKSWRVQVMRFKGLDDPIDVTVETSAA